MADFRLILASDDGYHLSFLPLVSAAYRKFFNCSISLIVVGCDYTANYNNRCQEYVDDLIVVSPSPMINEVNNAKMARLWLASQYDNTELLMLNDLDCCPLQSGYYTRKLSRYISGHVMTIGSDVYNDNEHERGKFPIGFLTAQGDVFAEVINPDGYNFCRFVDKWRGSREIDDKEDPELGKCAFSDESLIRLMLTKWNRPDLIIREAREYTPGVDTIDRSCWHNHNIDKLYRGEYVESHFFKPPERYKAELKLLYDYIGVRQPW